MITLIAFLLVLVGGANWLTIGLLQFDFVAGLFGSQSNIFSRIVYVLVGIGTIIITVNVIKNKGKLTFNFRKLKNKNKAQNDSQSVNNTPNTQHYTQDNANQGYNTPQHIEQFQSQQDNNQGQYQQPPMDNTHYNNQPDPNNYDNQQNYNNHIQNNVRDNKPQFNTEAGSDNDIRSISARLAEKHNSNRNYK